jgi:hypothetical protein
MDKRGIGDQPDKKKATNHSRAWLRNDTNDRNHATATNDDGELRKVMEISIEWGIDSRICGKCDSGSFA